MLVVASYRYLPSGGKYTDDEVVEQDDEADADGGEKETGMAAAGAGAEVGAEGTMQLEGVELKDEEAGAGGQAGKDVKPVVAAGVAAAAATATVTAAVAGVITEATSTPIPPLPPPTLRQLMTSAEYIGLICWFSVIVCPMQYYVQSIGYQLEQKVGPGKRCMPRHPPRSSHRYE